MTRLKRRFLKNRTAESSFFAKMELRKKFVRQVSHYSCQRVVLRLSNMYRSNDSDRRQPGGVELYCIVVIEKENYLIYKSNTLMLSDHYRL